MALTDAAGTVRPLQDRRSVVPQLDGPGDGAARPADLRLPAVQQELQPVVLRPRPVRRNAMLQVFAGPPEAGPPDDRLPGAARRRCPTASAACRSWTRRKCPDGCRACAEACPTDAIAVDGGGLRLDLGRCLFCTDCVRGLSRRGDPLHPGLPPGHADARGPGPATASTLEAGEGPGREDRAGSSAARSSSAR